MMLDKLSKDEINELIAELKASGYDVRENRKGAILKQEAEKLGMVDCYICQEIKKPILDIADWATNNKEDKASKNGGPSRTYKRGTVDASIEEEYRGICSGMLKIIQPYYGRLGCEQRGSGVAQMRESEGL